MCVEWRWGTGESSMQTLTHKRAVAKGSSTDNDVADRMV